MHRKHRDRIVCDRRLRVADVEAHATGPDAAAPLHGEFQVFSTSGASGLRGLFVYNARDWAVGLAATMRALVRVGARPDDRVIGVGAPPGVHMSPRIFATLQGGRSDVPRLSALTPLDDWSPCSTRTSPTSCSAIRASPRCSRASSSPAASRSRRGDARSASESVMPTTRERVQAAWGIDPVEYYA